MLRRDTNGNECFSSGPALSTIGRVVRSAFSFEDQVGGRVRRLSSYDESGRYLRAECTFVIFRCVHRPGFG